MKSINAVQPDVSKRITRVTMPSALAVPKTASMKFLAFFFLHSSEDENKQNLQNTGQHSHRHTIALAKVVLLCDFCFLEAGVNVVVAAFVARLAVYPAAATGREAGVRRNSRNKQVPTVGHSGADIFSTLECRCRPWRRGARVKESGDGWGGAYASWSLQQASTSSLYATLKLQLAPSSAF